MIDRAATLPEEPSTRERWAARLALGFENDGRRTVLRRRGAYGPLYVQRPFYPEGERCHSYLLHPPGGIAGGDHLTMSIDVSEGAQALLTTPAAGKCYRSAGAESRVVQHLRVAADGELEWLPQENLIFNGARARFGLQIELHRSARLLALDAYALGRPLSGESFDSGALLQSLAIDLRSEARVRPLLRERLCLVGDDAALAAPWGLRGANAFGALYAYPADTDLLRWLRAQLPHSVWHATEPVALTATLLDGLLVVRATAMDLEAQSRALRTIWALLREPLLKASPEPPRIWNT